MAQGSDSTRTDKCESKVGQDMNKEAWGLVNEENGACVAGQISRHRALVCHHEGNRANITGTGRMIPAHKGFFV